MKPYGVVKKDMLGACYYWDGPFSSYRWLSRWYNEDYRKCRARRENKKLCKQELKNYVTNDK